MTNPVKNYRARTPNNQPNPIDVFIGGRIRYFRKLRHVSQVELAGSVGTTFQQVQKYENGNNRVSGSRLWMISQVLQVPVSLFFEGINVKTGRSSVKIISGKEEAVYCPPDKFMPVAGTKKETVTAQKRRLRRGVPAAAEICLCFSLQNHRRHSPKKRTVIAASDGLFQVCKNLP